MAHHLTRIQLRPRLGAGFARPLLSIGKQPNALQQMRLILANTNTAIKVLPVSVTTQYRYTHSSTQHSDADERRHKPQFYKQEQIRQQSLNSPEAFWMEAVKGIEWIKPPTKALSVPENGALHKAEWFSDGVLNVSYNALDRHVEGGRATQTALIYDSPVTDTVRKFTYGELLHKVKQAATMLRANGVEKGDRVLIYMGAVPEAIVTMLACARLGAIHSVVFGGFAAAELAKRIEDCSPKVVVASSCGVENKAKIVKYKPLLDGALELCEHKPNKVVVLQRPQCVAELGLGEDSWADAVDSVRDDELFHGYTPVRSNDPLYILYTSGTTGSPKGVVRPSGSHAVVLKYTMDSMYACGPGKVYWAASDLGWILGHSYICYGPLLHGATSLLYEGKPIGTPDPSAYYRVMAEHKVNTFFTAPTALMVLRREDPHGEYRKKYDLTHVKAMFLAGERCPPEIQRWWVRHVTGVDDTGKEIHNITTPVMNVVSDNWWQTETGSPLVGIQVGLSDNGAEIVPVKYGSAGMSVQGVDLHVLRIKDEFDEDTVVDATPTEANPGEIGNIVLKLPLPPGIMTTLWRNEERFFDSYFKKYPGYYDTGDTGMVDHDGYVHILSRSDDVINVAAHRISTSSIEEIVVEHNEIAEACVVSRSHDIKGCVPVIVAVLKHHTLEHTLDRIKDDVVAQVRSRIGPFACVYRENFVFVERLPKTRSGKVLRKMIRSMISIIGASPGSATEICPVPTPATIEEEAVKDEIWHSVKSWMKAVPKSP